MNGTAPVKCAIWARVSTVDQHAENQLLAVQAGGIVDAEIVGQRDQFCHAHVLEIVEVNDDIARRRSGGGGSGSGFPGHLGVTRAAGAA